MSGYDYLQIQYCTPPCDEQAPLPVAVLVVPSLHFAPARPLGQSVGLDDVDVDEEDDDDGGGDPTASSAPAHETNERMNTARMIVVIFFIELSSVLPAITSAVFCLPTALLTLLGRRLTLT